MLNCNLCDYLKRDNCGNKCYCEITGFNFVRNIEEYDMEHPCYSQVLVAPKVNISTVKNTSPNTNSNENWSHHPRKIHFKHFKHKYNAVS